MGGGSASSLTNNKLNRWNKRIFISNTKLAVQACQSTNRRFLNSTGEFSFMYSTKEFTIMSLVEELTLFLLENVYRWLLQELHQSWLSGFTAFPLRQGPGGGCTMRGGALGGLAWFGRPHFPCSLAFSHVGGHLLGAGGYCGEAGFT